MLAGSDLRGTDFTSADLHDADLSHIRAGMSRGWAALVVFGSLVFSVGVGVVAGVSMHYLKGLYSNDDLRLRLAAGFVTAMLVAFLLVGIVKGLRLRFARCCPSVPYSPSSSALSWWWEASGPAVERCSPCCSLHS
jgi:hypothetical protein